MYGSSFSRACGTWIRYLRAMLLGDVIATTVSSSASLMDEVLLQAVAIEVDIAMEGHVPIEKESVLGQRTARRPVEAGEATQRPCQGAGR